MKDKKTKDNDIVPEDGEKQHKRRVRYTGTHPKTYKEKYKEHNPAKYAEEVAHIIQKGNTPAGMHISICVKEIMDYLDIKCGEKGMDATLGYGGHSTEMLKKLNHSGHLYGTDVDSIELPKTIERIREQGFSEKDFTGIHLNFAKIDQVVEQTGKLDFILADLGVSSMQIDNPDRGFSFKVEGPLDLRLDTAKGVPAYEKLKEMTEEEITCMLVENADEEYAVQIAKAISKYNRKRSLITTTTMLRNIIEEALDFLPKEIKSESIKKACQRTFQAIRIDQNSEYEVLYEFLDKLPDALASDGRVAILTFHSGEDRLVKKSFKEGLKKGWYKDISEEPIRPSKEECNANGRARSAKLRWAIRA